MKIKIIFEDFKEEVITGVNALSRRELHHSYKDALVVEFLHYPEKEYRNVHMVEVIL